MTGKHSALLALILAILVAGGTYLGYHSLRIEAALSQPRGPFSRAILHLGDNYRVFPVVGPNGLLVVAAGYYGNPKDTKVYLSWNLGDTWKVADLQRRFSNLVMVSHPIVTSKGTVIVPVFFTNGGGILRSTDEGTTWSLVYQNPSIRGMAYGTEGTKLDVSGDLFLPFGTESTSSILRSEDDGATWKEIYSTATTTYIYSVAEWRGYIVGTLRNEAKIVFSEDAGSTWTEIKLGVVAPTAVRNVVWDNVLSRFHISGEQGGKPTLWVGGGNSWIPYLLPFEDGVFRCPFRAGGLLLGSLAGQGNLIASADGGLSWATVFTASAIGSGPNAVRLAAYGDVAFLGAETGGYVHRLRLPSTIKGSPSKIMLWDKEPVTSAGGATKQIWTRGKEKMTFWIISSVPGTAYIQAFDEVGWNSKDIESKTIAANTLTPYLTTVPSRLLGIRFVPAGAAVVSIWAFAEP